MAENREIQKRTCVDYLKLITVEPTMFLYILAFMLTSVVEQALYVHKGCTVDLGYPEEICQNLTNHEEENKKVQVVVSKFHQYNDIASHVIPIILSVFIGAWSDRRGRKLLILLGLVGKLWFSVWIVINTLQDTWNLDAIILSASLPSGLTGADLSIFAGVFSYMSDVTTPETRTLRITILDTVYLSSMPIGIAIGKYLFALFNHSYTILFSINAFLLFLATLYSFFRLEWATSPKQEPLKLCCLNVANKYAKREDGLKRSERQPNCLIDFFDKEHLVESFKTVFKKRSHYGRLYLIILILSMGLYTFQRDERQMCYLYTNFKFHWTVNAFSDFRVYQSAIYVVGTLLCIPFMGVFLKLSDTTMLLLGTTSHATARIVYALAEEPWLFYLGATLALIGPVVAPVLRSMASKIVPVEERGKVFAILSVADTTVPLFSGVIYSQVYIANINHNRNAIFWVTFGTQMFVFFVALFIRLTSKNQPSEKRVEEQPSETQ